MIYNLPKPYLSYSAWYLWKTNKEEYRKRYYEGKKSFETVETIFGKKVAKKLEEDDTIKGSETRIEVTLKTGLKLLSYLDGFDEETLSITEYKSGHKNKAGRAPWDNIKVKKHKQLDWYSLMVKEKYGKVNPFVKLIWLETRFKNKETTFAGHILKTQSRELELTGYSKTFNRRIVQWERDKIKNDILKTALEISNDYTLWQQNKSIQQ
jgi:hypothetical protein